MIIITGYDLFDGITKHFKLLGKIECKNQKAVKLIKKGLAKENKTDEANILLRFLEK